MRIVFTATLAMALLAAVGAQAITYKWSFEAADGTSPGTVTGLLSGAQIGDNAGASLSVEVLSSPSGNVLGGGWSFLGSSLGGPGLTVRSDRSVDFADLSFIRDGGADILQIGRFSTDTVTPDPIISRLFSSNEADPAFNPFSPTGTWDFTEHLEAVLPSASFTEIAPAPIPLPASLPLALVAMVGLGLVARRIG